MPAATTKADLLAVADKEFGKLQSVIAKVPEVCAERPFEEEWSPRDVLVHRAHWIDLFLGWYRDGQAGKEVAFPAPGYKWSELKRYNAAYLATQTDVRWQEAQAALVAAHARWCAMVEELDQAALYGGPMKGANNKWTPGRWAEAAAPSHYRSAAKFIRA